MTDRGSQPSHSSRWPSRRSFGWLLALCLVCPAVGAAQEPQTLRWHWQPGQTFRVTTFQKVETDTNFGGKPLKMAWEITLEQDWHVRSVTGAGQGEKEPTASGAALVEQSLRRIQVRLDLPPASPLEFDSSSSRTPTGEAKAWAQALLPLIGPTATVTINARGEGQQWTPSKELLAVIEALPEDSQLRKLFSPDALSRLAKQGLCEFPEAAVAAGGEWQTTLELQSNLGKFRQQTTYQLADAVLNPATSNGNSAGNAATPTNRDADQGTLTKITAISQLAANSQPGDGKRISASRELKKQRQTASYLFNARLGYIVSGEGAQQLTTETRVRDTLVETTVNSQWRTRFAPVDGNASK